MAALLQMLEEAERLVLRCEIRLEQYRIHARHGRGSERLVMLSDIQRYEDAYRKLQALREAIRRDIELEQALDAA